MANTMYPTGVATTPIDFSGAANAFMQSALQTKLQEINQRKEQLTESGKAVAHFMSLEALPELAEGIREDFKGEIQGFRDKITKRFKDTNGNLTYDDKLMIEREYNRIGKNMEAKKVTAQKFAMAQQALWNKDANRLWTPETRTKVAEDFVKYSKGEDVDDPMLTLTSGVIIPPMAERLMSIAPEMMKRLDTISNIELKKDPQTGMIIAISTTMDNEESVRETVRQSLIETRMPEVLSETGEIDENKLNAAVNELVPPIQRVSQKVQPIQPRVGRSSGSGSGGIGKLTEMVETIREVPGTGKSINGYIDFPDSQTIQHIPPTRMINIANGKSEEVSSAKDGIILVGLSFDEGKAYFKAEGGVMQKNGEPVFGVKGRMPAKPEDRGAFTDGDIRNRVMEIAKGNIPADLPEGYVLGNPRYEQTDKGYVVRVPYTYKQKKAGGGWLAGKESKTGEYTVELDPVIGKEGATWYSTDLYTTGSNIMGATVKKYQTGGRSWEELLRAGRGGKTTVTPSSNTPESDPLKLF